MGRPQKEGKRRKVQDATLKKRGAFARFRDSQINQEGKKILQTEEEGVPKS
jgi:hypothetical protein